MLLNSRAIRFLVTRMARAYGFLDPATVVSRMRGFSKPSEVAEPIELLRAGVLFHARGLVNTKAIQNNMDWVWPYWVERQFNPADASFIPRAFSFSHINLTHRNWTAVGVPDVPYYPIVDPRGLVTPLFDGWSLDFWFRPDRGPLLLPSKLESFDQELRLSDPLEVCSRAQQDGVNLESQVTMELDDGHPICRIRIRITGETGGQLVVSLRPYNPEGVSFIETTEVHREGRAWLINDRHEVLFDRAPECHRLSTYKEGDVSLRLTERTEKTRVVCPVSMVSAAALFPARIGDAREWEVRVPIYDELKPKTRPRFTKVESLPSALASLATLQVPDERVQRLYDQAAASLVLFSPKDVYPGPYTYKRFWFRDAVFILNALLSLGGVERTRRVLEQFAPRQRSDGYYLSQEGEWDSNGEVLWFYHRFAELSGTALPQEWLDGVARGARWISRKRLSRDSGLPEAGLLPAGFSAEHLGPNDFYYWDDFWAVGGLKAAARLWETRDPDRAARYAAEADEFLATIQKSFPHGPERRFPGAIPASPHRRMDSGAVGSLVADYPLQLFPPDDPAITRTADYLCQHSLHAGGFFQDMIHSGVNAYLTLHLAQVRLRGGDPEGAWALMNRVAELASSTGQWPEAIHPLTGGGCMGDGQHIWAAAEWLMCVRNLFVREEGDSLLLGTGVMNSWIRTGELRFGPTLTPHGAVSIRLSPVEGGLNAALEADWRRPPAAVVWQVPGHERVPALSGGRTEQFLPTLP